MPFGVRERRRQFVEQVLTAIESLERDTGFRVKSIDVLPDEHELRLVAEET